MWTDARPGQHKPPTGSKDRDIPCPECGLLLPPREHRAHLLAAHGYVEVQGTPLARPTALASLWERVFTEADATAHDQLCAILLPVLSGQEPASALYVGAFQAELLRRADLLFSSGREPLMRLVECLRQHQAARPFFKQLLAADNPYIRQVGRELLLPDAGHELAGERVSAAEVQRWLDALCPREDVWEKIRLCQRLSTFGVAEQVVRDCLQRLRAERPVACPECGLAVPQESLDNHSRQAHGLYQFQGVRQSFQATLTTVLAALCRQRPEPGSWQMLQTLAQAESGWQPDARIAQWLGEALEQLPDDERETILPAVAEVILSGGCHLSLVTQLASASERAARHLALLLTTRRHAAVDPAWVPAICPLLAANRLPAEARTAAAATLLRMAGPDGPLATEIVTALSSGSGKARAVERLRELERRVGRVAVVASRIAALEEQMRLRCPRCGLQLQRPEMIRHLWLQHQLVLAGRRVREPWRLVEDWIEDYRQHGDVELLARCRAFGVHLDPEGGLRRVYRLFLARQVEDAEAHRTLLADAVRHGASLCPYCYALVAVPHDVRPRPLNCSHGRLSTGGYRVEVSESGLVPRLEVETPQAVVYDGPEPGRWLTRKGTTLLFGGPPVLSALILALLLSEHGLPSVLPVASMLVLGLAVFLLVQWHWRGQPAAADRAVDHAWTVLVPRLQANGLSLEDTAFVAGLALTSLKQGDGGQRAALLEQVLETTEQAVAAGSAPVAHLAVLRRLALEDAATLGRDLVALAVEQLTRSLEGKLPMVFAERLLADWESPWWTRGHRARLRVLLCDRAFEAGWEVRDLLALGHFAPALGAVLGTDHPDEVAQLRLLWSLRPSRPWDQCGPAKTVFELAADVGGGRRLLANQERLLLADLTTPPVFLTSRGLVFQEVLFTEPPATLQVRAQAGQPESGYELVVGEHRFSFAEDPTSVMDLLERWFEYHFGQFLPAVTGVHGWQTPDAVKTLEMEEPIRCPECRGLLRAQPGAVGMGVGPAPAESGSDATDESDVSADD